MRLSFGTAAALTLAAACVAVAAEAQQIEQAPLAPPPATGVGVPLPGAPSQAAPSPAAPSPAVASPAVPSAQSARPSRQIAEQPSTSLTTQDCVRMPTPAEQTDCLNQVASDGNYMPTPVPAPGSQMPMEFRLPLGKRQIPPPP